MRPAIGSTAREHNFILACRGARAAAGVSLSRLCRRRDRRRRGHGLLVCPYARPTGPARSPVRRARGRRRSQWAQWRLRPARRRDALQRGARSPGRRECPVPLAAVGESASTGWRHWPGTPSGVWAACVRRQMTLKPHRLGLECDALRGDGFDVDWHDAPRGYAAALLNPNDGAIQPARWVRRLAAHAVAAERRSSRASRSTRRASRPSTRPRSCSRPTA